MGSPVSVVMANLVMEDVERRALSTLSTPPRYWKRYIDDTFAILSKDLVDEFLGHLNSIETAIQFTVEKESTDGRLPFLDVCVQRNDDGTITTSVHRKPTYTNQYLAFNSHHPTAHKVSVVKTLMKRASTLCSSVTQSN
jgi:hypothetical protein